MITPDDDKWYCLEDLPNEIWEDIDGYIGLYQISNYSRIKSLSKYKNKRVFIMKPYRDNYGRYVIHLFKNGVRCFAFIHRLVAKTFIPNLDNKPEVNHINPITKELCDNRVCNLEWCTSSENSKWCVKCGNMYQPSINKFGKDNHRSKPIIQLDLDGSFVNRWENARDIERTIGIDYRYVSRCCNHKCKTAHSYIFMFEEEYYEQMGKVKN